MDSIYPKIDFGEESFGNKDVNSTDSDA